MTTTPRLTITPKYPGFCVTCEDPKSERNLDTEAEAVDYALEQLSCLGVFTVRHVERLLDDCLTVWCEPQGRGNFTSALKYT
jgi:hypothetical protein